MLARLVVWDEESEEDDATIEMVPLKISVTQQSLLTHGGLPREDDPNWIGYYITGADGGDVEIKPEWVGKSLNVEVAPSLVKALDDELERVADKWDGTIA